MKTIEIKIFNFKELNEEAKKKTIEHYYGINTEHTEWYDCTIEQFKENQKEFNVEKVYFSGFYSQGDGAMFEYDGISDELVNEAIESLNLPNWKKLILKSEMAHFCKGKHQGRYSHEKSCNHIMNFEVETLGYDNIENLFNLYNDDLETFIEKRYVDIALELYRSLGEEYYDLTSDEQIIETIEANDYFFTEHGGEIYC